jgi:hypothetical protein
MKARTEIDFDFTGDAQKVVEEWASVHGYVFKEKVDDAHIYQRGMGFWTAPIRLAGSQHGEHVHLEAYVYAPFLNRLMSLFLVPEEIQIESGGFVASIPRAMARKDINELLQKFNQPLLK